MHTMPRCQSGQYRIECKILIDLNSYKILLPLNIKNISMDSVIPLVGTQNISGSFVIAHM